MLEDEVNYLSTAPWPTGASGSGSSIQRLGIFRQGSEPASWIARSTTAGSGSGYAAWKSAYFSQPTNGDRMQDPDQDGLPNLVEYLLGSHPAAYTALSASLAPNAGSPRLELDYTLSLDADDATLAAQQSTHLGNWIPAAHDEVLSSDGFLQQRRAWLPIDTQGFLRLKATAPAP